MLTARAEYRLRLRASNASTRLTPLAIRVGAVGHDRAEWFERREDRRKSWAEHLDVIVPARAVEGVRESLQSKRLAEWLALPEVDPQDLAQWLPDGFGDDEVGLELVEDAAYAPYLARQEAELRDLRASEALEIPRSFDFRAVPGLSNEMVERLTIAAPDTLAAAGRIRGITPTALAALMVHARKLQAAA
jgi:tRNA uridine 5-carboxymethylaminomethyl modification enzyme